MVNKKGSKKNKYILFLVILCNLVAILMALRVSYNIYKNQKLVALQKENEKNILASLSNPVQITVDYSQQIGVGSPLLFGGAHTPLLNHIDAWDKIEDVGVTMIRRDFFIEQIIPSNITLESYKKNIKNIQDPSQWDQTMIRAAKERYVYARKRGMKTMGIVNYAPKWLTYSGTPYGLPKDWGVYEDIVKKTYKMFREDLDYLEIWNEPTYKVFNDVSNSNKTMDEIYIDIAKHTIKAIREVDAQMNDGKKIPLGGLVADNPKYAGAMLDKILKIPEIKNELAFISYHSYGHEEPSSINYRQILEKNGLANLPIFLTEWNYSSSEKEKSSYKLGRDAIVYTANQFIHFMNQGLAGANYYMLEPVDYNTPGIGIKQMGFYRWKNDKAELLPQAKTWRLFSKTMGLGKGESKIVVASGGGALTTSAWINTDNNRGAILVNNSGFDQAFNIKLTHIPNTDKKYLSIFFASESSDGITPEKQEEVIIQNNRFEVDYYAPANSVVGIILAQPPGLLEIIKSNLR